MILQNTINTDKIRCEICHQSLEHKEYPIQRHIKSTYTMYNIRTQHVLENHTKHNNIHLPKTLWEKP